MKLHAPSTLANFEGLRNLAGNTKELKVLWDGEAVVVKVKDVGGIAKGGHHWVGRTRARSRRNHVNFRPAHLWGGNLINLGATGRSQQL